MVSGRRTASFRRRRALAAVALALFLIAGGGTAIAAWLAHERAEDHQRAVDHDVELITTGLVQAIDRSTAGLAGAPGIVDATGTVSVGRFDAFAEGISREGPVIAAALELVVEDAGRPAFEAAHELTIVDDTGPGGRVIAPRRSTYYPVVAVYPDRNETRTIIGTDIGTDPARRDAAVSARDTGAAAVTPPVALPYSSEAGVLVVQPLYRPDGDITDTAGRRAALVGFVSISYSAAELVGEASRSATSVDEVTVLDSESLTGQAAPLPSGWQQLTFDVGGRTWVLRVEPEPGPSAGPPIVVVAIALLIAGLVTEMVRRSWRHDVELADWSRALVEQQRRTMGLQSLTATLATALTVPEVARATLEHGLPLIGATSGQLLVEDEGGAPAAVASNGVRSLDASVSERRVDIGADGRTLGLLTVSLPNGPALDAQGEAMLAAIAVLVGEALARARRYDSEHQMVTALQSMLLPVLPSRLGPIELAAKYQPVMRTTGVGGDWYDVLDTEAGPACVIGDVVGKGVKAAGVMGQLRIVTRTLAERGDPAGVLAALDDFAAEFNEAFMTTIAYVVIDLGRGRLRVGSAGHPPPLLLPADGPARWLGEATGPPLGIPPGRGRTTMEVPWTACSRLVMYTDGLVERRAENIDVGLTRLRDTAQRLAGSPARTFLDELVAALVSGADQHDDVAVLCVDLPARE